MDSDRESERLFSLQLSQVMDDIGVNSRMIARRRRTQLLRETISNVIFMLHGITVSYYIVGSRSEATTTLGMKSDTDHFYCDKRAHVALDLSQWQKGKPNYLVLRNELTPPQHCYLQRFRRDRPRPAVHPEDPDDVQDCKGRYLLTNTMVEFQDMISESGKIMIRHGPSMTTHETIDDVYAYHCDQLPRDCQFMFDRPRPGHLPRPHTLVRARESGVFLVPQGYSESPAKQPICRSTAFTVPSKLTTYPESKWQWRFSTTLMERFLMLDFSPVQVKVYTLTKIIRKTFFKPVFGDRFSTFHIKTAMLFTIENYPLNIWRAENILKCVSLLLTTLKRWLKQKYCPHFTISGVNLFVGKLNNWELPKLCSIISSLIDSKMKCFFDIQMDDINLRLRQYSSNQYIPCQNGKDQISRIILKDQLVAAFFDLTFWLEDLITNKSEDAIKRKLSFLQSMSDSQSDLEQEVVSLMTPFLCSTLASMRASRCIDLGQPITQDIFNWYQRSLDSDCMSSRLKFASMLYCSRQYDRAAEELTFCEGLLGPKVGQCCLHLGRDHNSPSSAAFGNLLLICPTIEEQKQCIMVCITFTKQERNCIPRHLQYEMFRSIEEENRHLADNWKNNIVADCIPFMYYLKHLTYRELHQPERSQTALDMLCMYTVVIKHGHIDTALNMLGHCYELQNRPDLAWMCYSRSLKIYNRNNAAIWHVVRLLHQCLSPAERRSGYSNSTCVCVCLCVFVCVYVCVFVWAILSGRLAKSLSNVYS